MARPDIAVSAPGKVLLAGGYLVLDRHYSGLVFALDARIHVHVTSLTTTTPGVELPEIVVRSPQFRDAEWRYGYRLGEHDGVVVTQSKSSSTSNISRNVFIETALSYSLTYISTVLPDAINGSTSFTVLADDSYYSQSSSTLDSDLLSYRFTKFNTTLSKVHKTGLGSSAALVTAFIASVLAHYLPPPVFSLHSDASRNTLHNLAQAAHCAAQGKVGSGFDVAAAVYGRCVYTRFSPTLLEELGEHGSAGFAGRLKSLVDSEWDAQVLKQGVAVPKGVRLVMCDVDCGSQTVGMVKKVLAWRKENPQEAKELWDELQTKNETLRIVLSQLAAQEEAAASDLTKTRHWKALVEAFASVRILIRKMSTLSGVPIEPHSQTALLDACSALPGIAGGVVPGAGGYDAVALLVADNEGVLKELKGLLEGWEVPVDATSGGESGGRVRMLSVREEMEGVQGEDAAITAYREWTT
ncbi:MAG: phosphomevalonate kinase [Trichoglossum hirsutum]|nr:MAG: phosphomevalonate kinase [Trichoglossum hirsutum]